MKNHQRLERAFRASAAAVLAVAGLVVLAAEGVAQVQLEMAQGQQLVRPMIAPPDAQGKPPPELMKAQAEIQMKAKELDIKGMEAQARAQKMQADTALEAQQFQANQAMHEQRMGLDVSKFHVQTDLEERAMGAKTDEAIARERLQLIDLAQNLAVHPESAPVVAPLVRPAFQAVTEREMEEKARRNKMPPMPGLGGGLPQ